MRLARPEDDSLLALLRSDVAVVSVVSAIGGGATSLVAHALATLGFGSLRALDAERLPTEPHGRLVWIDRGTAPGSHAARLARTIERWRRRAPHVRVVLSARSTTGRDDEAVVTLGGWSAADIRTLLAHEVARLGHRSGESSDQLIDDLVEAIDGCPRLVRSVALRVRALGLRAVRGERSVLLGDEVFARELGAIHHALPAGARRLLAELAPFERPVPLEVWIDGEHRRAALAGTLIEAGLVVREEHEAVDTVRLRHFARGLVLEPQRRTTSRTTSRTHSRTERALLAACERHAQRHREDPWTARTFYQRHGVELSALALRSRGHGAVRIIVALEPWLSTSLDRPRVHALWNHAAAEARRTPRTLRAAVALGRARTAIARGEHEAARALLDRAAALDDDTATRAQTATYRGHLAAWRGEHDAARVCLDEAAHLLERAPVDSTSEDGDRRLADAADDLRLQELFLAFRTSRLDDLEALARSAAARATSRPAPRLGAIARRYVAERALVDGRADVAATLFRATRDELASIGDQAGALYVTSRLVEALTAGGAHAEADEEAERARRVAAEAREDSLELAFLHAAGARASRVSDLAWRAQIPEVAERASAWLAGQTAGDAPTLALDALRHVATLAEQRVDFTTRLTLWRLLMALADAHATDAELTTELAFAAAWPATAIDRRSQQKRLQTAVWTLRRELLGAHLVTTSRGYRLGDIVVTRR